MKQSTSDPILLVLAADHHIAKTSEFQQAISRGVDYAKQGKLVTFGITPDAPETGYGYIKQGEPLSSSVQTDTNGTEQPINHAYAIECFVEKPDTAKQQKKSTSAQNNTYGTVACSCLRHHAMLKNSPNTTLRY